MFGHDANRGSDYTCKCCGKVLGGFSGLINNSSGLYRLSSISPFTSDYITCESRFDKKIDVPKCEVYPKQLKKQ